MFKDKFQGENRRFDQMMDIEKMRLNEKNLLVLNFSLLYKTPVQSSRITWKEIQWDMNPISEYYTVTGVL